MNMKKKVLTLGLVAAMLLTSAGATLAYFTDSETKTNVMVNGKVDIDLEERMKTDTSIVEFKDEAIPLFPLSDEVGNVSYNKIVDVYNDGPSDAYIRTIVLVEHNELADDPNAEKPSKWLHYGYSSDVELTYDEYVTIDGKKYVVWVFDQANDAPIVKGGKVQSLQSVWYDAAITDEMLANNTDGKLDILVLAQGVQTEGFKDYDEAMASFGKISADNLAKWFKAAYPAVINDHAKHVETYTETEETPAENA